MTGWFIVQRHAAYFFVIHLCLCTAFLSLFLRHTGCDSTFAFAWLDAGFDPHNATDAASVLWSSDPLRPGPGAPAASAGAGGCPH